MRTLVVLFGWPGSGKSSVGKAVSLKLGYRFYDMDVTLPEPMKEKLRKGVLVTEEEINGYVQEVIKDIDSLLKKESVVASLSLFLNKHRLLLKQRFPEATFFSLEAQLDILKKRLHERKNHFFDETLFDETLSVYEPVNFDHVSIDADHDLHSVIEEVISHIK